MLTSLLVCVAVYGILGVVSAARRVVPRPPRVAVSDAGAPRRAPLMGC